MVFEIQGKNEEILKQFQKIHAGCRCGSAMEKFSYDFCPTGLGTAVTVICSCSRKLLLGDFMDDEPSPSEEEMSVMKEDEVRSDRVRNTLRTLLRLDNPRIFRIAFQEEQDFGILFHYVSGLYNGLCAGSENKEAAIILKCVLEEMEKETGCHTEHFPFVNFEKNCIKHYGNAGAVCRFVEILREKVEA